MNVKVVGGGVYNETSSTLEQNYVYLGALWRLFGEAEEIAGFVATIDSHGRKTSSMGIHRRLASFHVHRINLQDTCDTATGVCGDAAENQPFVIGRRPVVDNLDWPTV